MVSDHQPLKNLESLATKVNRVQRWFDFLSTYNYKLAYRPGRLNGNADLLSRLPLPGAHDETNSDLRLTDPTDIDVFFVGASGVQPRLRRGTGSVFGGLEEPDVIFAAGEVEHRPAPRTTDEQAQLIWQVMQSDRNRELQQITYQRIREFMLYEMIVH